MEDYGMSPDLMLEAQYESRTQNDLDMAEQDYETWADDYCADCDGPCEAPTPGF